MSVLGGVGGGTNPAGERWLRPQPMRGVRVCEACSHYESEHRLAPHGDLVVGPYCCRACGCEIGRESPALFLTNRQYDELSAAQDAAYRGLP